MRSPRCRRTSRISRTRIGRRVVSQSLLSKRRKTPANHPLRLIGRAMTMPSLSGTGPYTSALKRALSTSSPLLTKVLRDGAINAGWDWEDIASVSVQERNGHLVVVADESRAEKVLDAEYGTTETTPKPAIRHFANSTDWHRVLIADALKEAGL